MFFGIKYPTAALLRSLSNKILSAQSSLIVDSLHFFNIKVNVQNSPLFALFKSGFHTFYAINVHFRTGTERLLD